MRRTFRYTISLATSLLILLPAMAQEGRVRGPRIGYNAGSLALFLLEPDRQIHTISVDYEIKQDIYPVLELGWQKVDLAKSAYHYKSGGVFARIGVDKNLFKYDNPVDYDMGFAGLRYGMARFAHSASNIDIEESYWGNLEDAVVPEKQMNAHWISVGGGLRAEVFHNFFMGWSVFANIKFAGTKDSHMNPYNIPGFGDGSKRLNVIINYTFYYRIAIAKFAIVICHVIYIHCITNDRHDGIIGRSQKTLQMKKINKNLSRNEIMSRVGNMAQMAGAQRMICDEGRGKGTSVIRVRNGRGLDFTLVPDRGMDILDVYYKGVQLAWISNNGGGHPAYSDDRNFGWLRSFGGGMLATCGLRNVGPPVDEEGEHFGLHGRISSLPASHVNSSEEWIGDDYVVKVSGQVREANTFGENMVLERQVTVNSNKNEILLHDRIRNEGFRPEPLMLLYHFNWGSPLLAADSQLLMDTQSTKVRDANASPGSWNDFSDPVHGIAEVVYLHKLRANDDHIVSYELRNDTLGKGIKVSWDQRELPFLTQWKMLGEGEYVLGLEPGNCYPGGRTAELKEKRGEILQSFGEKEVSIRIQFMDV